MKEDLLQHIWQFQLFDKSDLLTADGQKISIVKPGNINENAGPDFLNAQIKIGDIVWFGSVEIHVDPRHWKAHHHDQDISYENVILHVIWNAYTDVFYQDGSLIPTLLIAPRVKPALLEVYRKLLDTDSKSALPCAESIQSVSSIIKISTIESAAVMRLNRKSSELLNVWNELQKDWNQLAFYALCKAFGFKVNAEAFATLGKKVNYHKLKKETPIFSNIVAFLLEVSSLKDRLELSDDVRKIAVHLRNKYKIDAFAMQGIEFRKARLRPANFPELRLLQLAAFCYQNNELIKLMIESVNIDELHEVFTKTNYMISHQRNDFPQISQIGKTSIDAIIINAIIPFRYAYGIYHADENLQTSCIRLLESIPAENNSITKIYNNQRFEIKTAMESQGILEQYQYFCKAKKCLACRVGNSIMKIMI